MTAKVAPKNAVNEGHQASSDLTPSVLARRISFVTSLPLFAFALALLTAALAAIVPLYFARRKPGYSHLRDTISELGEIGSPVGRSVSYLGFVPTGVLLWLFLLVAAAAVPSGEADALWALSLVGAGYFFGGIFRCDPGAPLVGSWRTMLHNIFGGLEYLGATAAFTMLQHSTFWSPLSGILTPAGMLVFAGFVGMSFPHPYRGIVQRVAETIIFGGLVLMGGWVYHASA